MSVVIVGGDHLGNIEKKLREIGANNLIHVTGRKAKHRNSIKLPREAAFVLVFTDYVNHCTASMIKEEAKSLDIQTIFAKRCWSSVQERLIAGGFVSA
ncbi:hypothetical protein SCACP_06810 [Sporomusa carbonis]|uniref:DUF2325 domain-containing protein n=1 Tax=Sporomusa carbonis TaxID=3076075 RepID=UPI003A78B819